MRSARAPLLVALAAAPLLFGASGAGGGPEAGAATILEAEVRAHILQLATAPLEGRDTPSLGLEQAARYLEGALAQAGLQGVGPEGSFRRNWVRDLPAPAPDRCKLELEVEGSTRVFELGREFVPVPGQGGEAEGELAFLGFGIDSKKEPYDDLKGSSMAGRIALIVEGEPRHRKLFEGPEVTPEADLYQKLEALEGAKVRGVIAVRRAPAEDGAAKDDPRPLATGLSFRSTWASWNGEAQRNPAKSPLPVLEVTGEVGLALLGEDPLELALRIDKSGKPLARSPKGRRVRLASAIETGPRQIPNVVGLVPGSDPALAGECVVIGAHFDHIGVDSRGRVGFGADDNASGTAAVLEVAQALAASPPRRSVLVCFFSGEEDGLLGSAALCRDPPRPIASMVAMLNLDMVGRGRTDEVVALGTNQNPYLGKVLERAQRAKGVGVKSVVTGKGEELWQRSDHYSFHEAGVPVLFLFEGLPITDNPDYHTWRDTLDKLDLDKVTRTARMAFHTTWLLANDDARPPAPRF